MVLMKNINIYGRTDGNLKETVHLLQKNNVRVSLYDKHEWNKHCIAQAKPMSSKEKGKDQKNRPWMAGIEDIKDEYPLAQTKDKYSLAQVKRRERERKEKIGRMVQPPSISHAKVVKVEVGDDNWSSASSSVEESTDTSNTSKRQRVSPPSNTLNLLQPRAPITPITSEIGDKLGLPIGEMHQPPIGCVDQSCKDLKVEFASIVPNQDSVAPQNSVVGEMRLPTLHNMGANHMSTTDGLGNGCSVVVPKIAGMLHPPMFHVDLNCTPISTDLEVEFAYAVSEDALGCTAKLSSW